MRHIQPGKPVFDVRGRRIGEIRDIRHCCFNVDLFCVRPEAIFQAGDSSVELICDLDQLNRYACAVHTAGAAAAR
ncbi:MAG: hypothetical protein AB7J35_05615 [Dehalococcoidia bacterium]